MFRKKRSWGGYNTDSNEIGIIPILWSIPYEDRTHISIPIAYYDRDKVYQKSNINQMMCMVKGSQDTYISIVYNYINGHDLADIISKHPTYLTDRNIRKIIKQTWNGLMSLHRNRIVHSDIKPANIMVDDDDNKASNVKVIDFGKSSHIPKVNEEEFKVVRKQALKRSMSTPAYISATLLLDNNYSSITNQDTFFNYMRLSDIWAFGLSIFEMFAKTPYYAYRGMIVRVLGTIMRDMEDNLTPGSSIDIDPNAFENVDPAFLDLIRECATYRPISVVPSEEDYADYAESTIKKIDTMIDNL